MSGVFLFMTHISAIMGVATAKGPAFPMMQHTPMNMVIAVSSAALGFFYAAALNYRHSRILLYCLYSFCGRGAAWYVHNVCSCVVFRVLKV